MKFAAPTLLVACAVFGAGDATVAGEPEVVKSLAITVPHGFPKFAIVARIDDEGQRVTISQPLDGYFGDTARLDQPEFEARVYTIGGQELKPNVLQNRLSGDSVVLISTDGNFPSREYSQYLKPRTVVFVFKTSGLFPFQHHPFIRLKVVPEQANKR